MKSGQYSGIWLIVIGLVLMAYSLLSTFAQPELYQYIALCPPVTESVATDQAGQSTTVRRNDELKSVVTTLSERAQTEWAETVAVFSVSAMKHKADINGIGGGSAQACLTGAGSEYFTLRPFMLLAGRMLYPEEMKNGAHSVLLSEKLALQLFQVTAPVGRYVTLGDARFEVVGILRQKKELGDLEELFAYLPLPTLYEMDVTMESLQVTAQPVAGSGALASFSSLVSAWRQGDLYSLPKEKMRTWLSARYLVCAALLYGILTAIGLVNALLRRWRTGFRERLMHTYAARLTPRLTGGVLTLGLCYAACAALLVLLVQFALEPVYVFPEWIPTVLVEPEDIAQAFWHVRDMEAGTVTLRTPEVIRLRFFASLVNTSVMLILGGFLLNRLSRIREKWKQAVYHDHD